MTLPLPRVTGGRYVVQLPKPYLRSKSVIFPTPFGVFMATKNSIPYWRKAFIDGLIDNANWNNSIHYKTHTLILTKTEKKSYPPPPTLYPRVVRMQLNRK